MKIPVLLSCVVMSLFGYGQKSASDFVTTWKTNNLGTLSNDSAIYITADDTNFVFNYDVDWNNDGYFDTLGVTGDIAYQYPDTGIYTIRIRGEFPRIEFGWRPTIQVRDAEKLISVDQWGDMKWKRLDSAFTGCWRMDIAATDTIFLDSLINPSLKAMFSVTGINADLNHWDVSSITDMTSLFDYAFNFNKPLNNWDVSSVTEMSSMFEWAKSFNQSLSSWEVSAVVNMERMFEGADSFNQPINAWDVSSVVNMREMFKQAYSFNQPLNNWDISSVQNLEGLFWDASSFNQNINDWDVSSISSMEYMFESASSFNQPLNNWDVSSVTSTYRMFSYATSFNQPLDNWDVTSIVDLKYMFMYAVAFNQPINNWDLTSAQSLNSLFRNAWSFNQNLGDLNISAIYSMYGMLDNSGLSVQNYDSTLIGWYNQSPSSNISLGANGLEYCYATSARDALINSGWIVSGDTIEDGCPFIYINEHVEMKESISIYPNPNSGSFTIDFKSVTAKGEIEIYTMCGKRVYQQATNNEAELKLDLNVSAGVYVLRFVYPSQSLTQSLMIR